MKQPPPSAWLGAGALCALAALLVAWTGGLDVRLAGIPLRSRAWERPAALALLFGIIGIYGVRRELPAIARRIAHGAERAAGPAVLLAAFAAGVAGSVFGTAAAGGSDSSGYVSQADLFARGRLTDVHPQHPAFTWPDAPATFAPLGYVPGREPGTLAPTYPPGLPLLMAPLAAIDARAVFLIVPVAAALAVWLCGRAGRALDDPLAGAIAACLLAGSPTFLYHTVQPMGDVPVTAGWLGALLLTRRSGIWSAAGAGGIASLAILIRPNLAPLAILVAAAARSAPGNGALHGVLCLVGMAPGLAALGWIQTVRYGSPLASGYGDAADLFAAGNVLPNAWQYARWMTEAHTPLIWSWVLAPVGLWRARLAVRRHAFIYAAVIAATVCAYLPYGVFNPEEWQYTRFLLPALPLMLVLGASTALAAARSARSAYAAPAVLLAAAAIGAVQLSQAVTVGTFELRAAERRYPAVADYIRTHLPPHALVVADQHSGSVHYYARRPILRWPLLDPASLDAALTGTREAGYAPYLVLDAFEEVPFRARFAPSSTTPDRLRVVAEIQGTRIYEIR